MCGLDLGQGLVFGMQPKCICQGAQISMASFFPVAAIFFSYSYMNKKHWDSVSACK